MLGIAEVSDDQVIVVKPAVKFSAERGVYLAPVRWTGQTMMFCITPQRLQQEFSQAVAAECDIADVFNPETYRSLAGEGVYLDYYGYTPMEPGKSRLAYQSGIGVCYMAETGERYTRADFLRLCNGEEAIAQRLFDLCDWQLPETLLDEELRDGAMQLPTLKFAPSLQLTYLTFHPEEPVPDEAKQGLLSLAGWQESLSRCWTHEGQATVPYGIAYRGCESGVKIIDIEPTPNGYRVMKQLFQESIETYQEKLARLDTLVIVTQDSRFAADVHALLEEVVAEKRASIEDAVSSLTESIAELERCGY